MTTAIFHFSLVLPGPLLMHDLSPGLLQEQHDGCH